MDAFSLTSLGIGAAALVVVAYSSMRLRRMARSVREALERAGASDGSGDASTALPGIVDRLVVGRDEAIQERALLAETIGSASIGILVTDVNGTVRVANHAAAGYFGARHGEAVAEVRIREAIGRAIAEDATVSRDVTLYTPARRALLVVAVPLLRDGERLGAAAYVHDITEQRRVEAMRRDFVANAGHELKTPLGALSVLAETLGARRDDPAVVERLSHRIVEESARLATLLDDLLDLSRVETAPARFAPTAMATVVADLGTELSERAAEYGADLIPEPVPGDAVVNGDLRQLRSLIVNLVDNAIKYSEPGGEGARPRVWLRSRVEGESVVLEVQDEGIGIPEAHQARVFERFYRVDRARSRSTGGTGLGLSIVRNVAVNHGGEVTVESKVGEGSLFRVTLPLWREP